MKYHLEKIFVNTYYLKIDSHNVCIVTSNTKNNLKFEYYTNADYLPIEYFREMLDDLELNTTLVNKDMFKFNNGFRITHDTIVQFKSFIDVINNNQN